MRTRQKSSASTKHRRSPNRSTRRSPHRSQGDNPRNSTRHRNDRNRPSRSTRKPERYRDESPQARSASPRRDNPRTQSRGDATTTAHAKDRQDHTPLNNTPDQQTVVLQEILTRLNTLEQHMPKNIPGKDGTTSKGDPRPSTSRDPQDNSMEIHIVSSQPPTTHNKQPARSRGKDDQNNKDQNNDEAVSDVEQTAYHRTHQNKRRNDETDSSSSDDEYFSTLPSSSKRRRLHNKGESSYDTSSESEDDYSAYDKPITSFGTLVGEGIQQKIKLKILADKFVEMSSLLPQHRSTDPEEFIMKQGRNSSATFVKQRPKTSLSISKWNEAFEIYMAIYLEKAHSSSDMLKLARSLLTYKKEVNNLCKLGYDWLAYDHHFRSDRAAKPFPWATTRQDLLMEYQPQRRNFRPYSTQQQSKQYGQKKSLRTKDGNHIPFGYCMAFHTRNSRCETPNCSFQHSCPKCATRHPIYRPCNNNTNTKSKEDMERSKK